LDQAAQNDAGIMAVGLILFWPVLFALGGTKQQEAEYARLKGEYDAAEQAAIQKKCAHTVPGGQTTAAAADPAVVTTPLRAQSPIQPAVLTTSPAVPTQQVQPQQVAAAPIKTTAATSSAAGVSKYMYSAERFAKTMDALVR